LHTNTRTPCARARFPAAPAGSSVGGGGGCRVSFVEVPRTWPGRRSAKKRAVCTARRAEAQLFSAVERGRAARRMGTHAVPGARTQGGGAGAGVGWGGGGGGARKNPALVLATQRVLGWVERRVGENVYVLRAFVAAHRTPKHYSCPHYSSCPFYTTRLLACSTPSTARVSPVPPFSWCAHTR